MQLVSQNKAKKLLQDGELLIYPTESFYGLGCNALDGFAVASIFHVKKRNAYLPLPVIVANLEQIDQIAELTSTSQADLEIIHQHFWGGPLSVILPAKSIVPTQLSGGTGRIAMRISSHPDAHKLVSSLDFPICASSANISGRPPTNLVSDLDPELLTHVPNVLETQIKPEGKKASTLIELEGQGKIKVLRQGAIPNNSLEKFFQITSIE